jgi:hypothetical protein
MMILRLEKDEIPLKPYDGDYQNQFGYVKSKRRAVPVGMEESEWEGAYIEGGPEDLLDILARSGPPWKVLSERLKIIDHKFEVVTEEYDKIRNAINELRESVGRVSTDQTNMLHEMNSIVRKILTEESSSLQNRWLVSVGSLFIALSGLALTILTNIAALSFLQEHGAWLGILIFITAIISLVFVLGKKK